MPKKGRRTERDEALGVDPGGLGGDEDYDWIKYLGEGRSSASSAAISAPTTAVRTQARTAAAPPARPVAPSVPMSAMRACYPAVTPTPGAVRIPDRGEPAVSAAATGPTGLGVAAPPTTMTGPLAPTGLSAPTGMTARPGLTARPA